MHHSSVDLPVACTNSIKCMLFGCMQACERQKALENENSRLRYQIVHLKRAVQVCCSLTMCLAGCARSGCPFAQPLRQHACSDLLASQGLVPFACDVVAEGLHPQRLYARRDQCSAECLRRRVMKSKQLSRRERCLSAFLQHIRGGGAHGARGSRLRLASFSCRVHLIFFK